MATGIRCRDRRDDLLLLDQALVLENEVWAMDEKLDLSTVKDREPWERQKRETAKAFAAFSIYKATPAYKRSIRACLKTLHGEIPSGKQRQWEYWSSLWAWVERATRWDARLAQEANIAQIEGAIQQGEQLGQMRTRHLKEAQLIQQKALKRLSKMVEEELSPAELLRYIHVGIALEREAMGEAKEIEIIVKNAEERKKPDYVRQMSDEELLTLIENAE